ncbi:MAG: patatin [Gammaproteobacteria bacterium]|nr:MAG: patatin [Gammaproteobacteria bacterium]
MKKDISIALSGGGVRSMAYHAGVLKYFAEQNSFEKVSKISSVSGGSLLIGLIYKENGYEWPSSEKFLNDIYPQIRKTMISVNIQTELLKFILYKPWNWLYIFSRAKALSKVIEITWGVSAPLSEISPLPEWSINGTTIENGKRFRFKNNTLGDYETGYAKADKFSLSQAMAVSAAFPGGIGPLVIKTKLFEWKKRTSWNSSDGGKVISPSFKKLHLYDGGVYDNLGTEPLFDSGSNKPKNGNENIFVSDAGKPLFQEKHVFRWDPRRILRILDITMDQARALRVRSFMSYLENRTGQGGYALIGQHPQEFIPEEKVHNHLEWLSSEQVKYCSKYGTDLKAMSESDFDLISTHGYESTKAINIVRSFLS